MKSIGKSQYNHQCARNTVRTNGVPSIKNRALGLVDSKHFWQAFGLLVISNSFD